MRRKEKEINDERVIEGILSTAQVCRIAMVDDGVPYVVPVNFGYQDRILYVHSASAGRKIDALKRNNLVCFEMETESTIIKDPEACGWGTRCRSLIGYGRAELIIERSAKKRALDIIMAHYGKTEPGEYDERQLSALVILRIPIDTVTCKQLGSWQ
jgi:nitroimidazol reductase NimA-like FMN-containing flavoprotein (pyridoxamine 5'-phosphate oxidase superfamily)